MFNKMFIRLIVCVFALICSNVAWSGVVAQSTRLVIHSTSQEFSLSLKNLNSYPVLVQTWIDHGEADTGPDEADPSFVVLPPIFKMNSGDMQNLRILYLPERKPSDRELLYWLNVLEVPPSTQNMDEEAAKLVVTMRTQLKVFVRPPNLTIKPDAALAMLDWQVSQVAKACKLSVRNPGPYHVSFAYLEYADGPETQRLDAGMLMPFGDATFDLPACPGVQGALVRFAAIDDSGNPREHSVTMEGYESAAASLQSTAPMHH